MTPQPESWFDRAIRVVRQKLAARAARLDEPHEAIDLLMAQQLEAIARTRADLAAVTSGEKRLRMMSDELTERARAHVETARSSLATGEREPAARSMRRAIAAEMLQREAARNAEAVTGRRRDVESLLEQLREQYESLRVRRESVRAMSAAARAVTGGERRLAPSDASGSEREALLQRSRETLADLEAEASALQELRRSGVLDPMGAAEFDNREIAESEIERRLRGLEDEPRDQLPG